MILTELISFIESNRFKGRGECFGFGDTLEAYLVWSFKFNYLFVASDENGIIGIGVAYPIENKFCGDKEQMFSFRNPVKSEEESDKDICIMDFISTNENSGKQLFNKFKTRYPNWENQNIYACRFDAIKKITTKYIQKWAQKK